MTLINELRFAFRQFFRSPGFAVLSVVTLALGIGATTAIFSLVDQVLLRNLPVREPKQLVMLDSQGGFTGRTSSHGGKSGQYFSYPMYRDFKQQNAVFDGVAAVYPGQAGVQWKNEPTLARFELVTGNYFDVLGVRPAIGRVFVDSDEGAKGSSPIVVLGFEYWQRRFGADPTVIGKTLLVNGQPYQIIGVSSPGFRGVIGGSVPDFFVPMNQKAQITPGWDDLDQRRSRWLNIFARLKPGVTARQAEASLTPLFKAFREDEFKEIKNRRPDFHKEFVETATIKLLAGNAGFPDFADQLRKPLMILLGMVGLLAFMAAVNVAGLLLVRAAGRVREMSVRYALGATRQRVARQLLIEGLVLGIAGGICGAVLAPLISGTLLRTMFTGVDVLPLSSRPDARMLAFDIVVSIGLSLLFSVTPVWQFWRPNVVPALKQQTVTAAGGQAIFRRAVVGVQIGLSLLLLIGAGLFIRTLHNLKTVDVGFTTDHLVTFGLEPQLAGYTPEQVSPLYQRVLETLAAQPGVKSVALTDDPDLANNNSSTNIIIAGHPELEEKLGSVEHERVSERYVATLQQPLLAGRFVDNTDQLGSATTAVVNAALAKTAFGDVDKALGQTFERRGEAIYTIVGVVGDVRHTDVKDEHTPAFYTSIFQEKEPRAVQVVVRTYQEPSAALGSTRASIKSIDSRLVLDQLQTMDEQVAGLLSTERLMAMLATGFGVLAVLMAAIGLYGVLAFSTAQRTREIGIRMALGASRISVVQMVVREVLLLAGLSVAAAIPIALMLARLVKSQLYGVSAHDPLTIAIVVAAVALVACAAAFLPARRASTVDPMKALRYE